MELTKAHALNSNTERLEKPKAKKIVFSVRLENRDRHIRFRNRFLKLEIGKKLKRKFVINKNSTQLAWFIELNISLGLRHGVFGSDLTKQNILSH